MNILIDLQPRRVFLRPWGKAIELRVGKQKASFRNGNPYGKFDMETIK